MAFRFSKIYNKTAFAIDTKDFEYKKLSELNAENEPNKVYKLNGIYLNRGKFGMQGVLILSDLKLLVNAPLHLTETIQAILADVEAIEAIENGKVGFTIYSYEAKEKQCFSIRFVDL